MKFIVKDMNFPKAIEIDLSWMKAGDKFTIQDLLEIIP